MTDETSTDLTPTEVTPLPNTDLKLSKLYQYNQARPLLTFMVPQLHMKVAAELEIEQSFPRFAEDGDNTRIIVNYRNKRKNSQAFKILDDQRLTRPIDIDNFLNGYAESWGDNPLPDDPHERAFILVLNSLSSAITTSLGFNPEQQSVRAKLTAESIAMTLISVLYDDPLDVLVMIDEMPAELDSDVQGPIITAIWATKARPVISFDPAIDTVN